MKMVVAVGRITPNSSTLVVIEGALKDGAGQQVTTEPTQTQKPVVPPKK